MMTRFTTSAVTALVIAGFAVALHAQQTVGGRVVSDPAKPETLKPTPRTADGHPDLSGVWNAGNPSIRRDQSSIKVILPLEGVNQDKDNVFAALDRISVAERAKAANKPPYKPELAAKVKDLEVRQSQEDPAFYCKPAGVPRMGPPAKIVQTPTEVILLYGQGNQFRVIPIDGRPHDPIKSQDTTWYGDAVGKWEGDTMVIDIIGFNDESWLGWPGWLHSNNMHVIEKYTRTGNTLRWESTVEDPDTLLEPFKFDARTIRLNPDPKATFIEDLPCEERDTQHIVTHERG
jgi:hypothetical protein